MDKTFLFNVPCCVGLSSEDFLVAMLNKIFIILDRVWPLKQA